MTNNVKSKPRSIIYALAFAFVLAVALLGSRPADAYPKQYYWHCLDCIGTSCYRVQDGATACQRDYDGYCWSSGTCYSFVPDEP